MLSRADQGINGTLAACTLPRYTIWLNNFVLRVENGRDKNGPSGRKLFDSYLTGLNVTMVADRSEFGIQSTVIE